MQGRALLNAIGNLELTGAYAEALSKLGLALENVAAQVWLQMQLIIYIVSWFYGFYNLLQTIL